MNCRHQAPLSFSVSGEFVQIHVLWVLSGHLILCRPLLLLPSIFPNIRVFSNESALHIRWPKYWSFHISPSNEYSGLISFRIDWLDLLAIQGTLKNLLQHHNSKALWQYFLFSEPFERHHALYLLLSQCVFPKNRIFSYRATVQQSNSRNLTLWQ